MPERPVECSGCKKPIACIYKEIVDSSALCSQMCADCPILDQKLHGTSDLLVKKEGISESEMGLCCGNCRTSLETIRMGHLLGCSECYTVFADTLITELIAADKIAFRGKKIKTEIKTQPIHVGKTPQKPIAISPTNQLTTLNEALNEALQRENYEQAAWLRDQIKALVEKGNEGKS